MFYIHFIENTLTLLCYIISMPVLVKYIFSILSTNYVLILSLSKWMRTSLNIQKDKWKSLLLAQGPTTYFIKWCLLKLKIWIISFFQKRNQSPETNIDTDQTLQSMDKWMVLIQQLHSEYIPCLHALRFTIKGSDLKHLKLELSPQRSFRKWM